LVDQLLNAFTHASLDSLGGAGSGATGPSAPPRRRRPSGSKPASKERGSRRKVDVSSLAPKVRAVLKTAGREGLRSENIRAQLGLEKAAVARVLQAMLADKTVRKTGKKRATTYFSK
jgi:hypothetical protein